MVHALEEIRRLLKPDGCLIDIHPAGEAKFIKVYQGRDILFAEPDPGFSGEEVRQAEDALAQVVQRGLFVTEHDSEFDLPIYASSIAELVKYLEEIDVYEDSPKDETVEARMTELFSRIEELMIATGDGAEVAYHERARITRLKPISRDYSIRERFI